MFKRLSVVHPFLFALFPVLFLFAQNIDEVNFVEILLPLAVILFAIAILFLLIKFWVKDSNKSGIILSLFIFFFFSYGHLYEGIRGFKLGGLNIGDHKFLLPAWLIIFALITYIVKKYVREALNLTKFLNVMAITMLVLTIFNIGSYYYRIRDADADKSRINQDSGSNQAVESKSSKEKYPDIYFIILDGYASDSTLKDLYKFDNKDFTDFLENKGFYLAEQARCNYPLSYLSIASTLNMDYLNKFSSEVGENSRNRKITYRLTRDSNVLNFLKKKGYMSIHFASGWRETNDNPYADTNIRTGQVNEFLILLIETTMLNYFSKNIIGDDARKRINGTFDKLADIDNSEKPKYIFAHILVPHPPYIFDREGRPVPEARLKMSGKVWEHRANYINQMIYINKRVKNLVNEILSKSNPKPVIVIQSDHGSASIISHNDYEGWNNPTVAMLKERYRIFSAIYIPQNYKNELYPSITSVNIFRVIFNTIFDADFKTLDDQSYFSTYETPYQFINVTDKVKYDQE